MKRAVIMAFVVTLAAPAARASRWETTFAPGDLDKLVIPGRERISLVAAGTPGQALDEVYEVLKAAIKGSQGWELVDGDIEREVDEDLDDGDILELERDARAVDAIWIVRLLPLAPGQIDPTAAVTIYAPLGTVLRSFHAVAGRPLYVAEPERDLPAQYLRQRISPVRGGQIDSEIDSEEFQTGAGFAQDGKVLSEARDLYIAMGRFDLLRRYDSAASDKRLVTIISGGVIFVGAVLFMQDVFDAGGEPTLDIGALGITGLAVGGAGVVGVAIGLALDPDPLDFAGKVEAATKYNADLKRRLGGLSLSLRTPF